MAQSKSAYAAFCESKGVKGIGMYIDEKLVDVMDKAAEKAGVKRNEWIMQRMIAGVRDAGFEYEAATKESIQDENARLKALVTQLLAANATKEVEDTVETIAGE